ncbi:MAG: hypothetical protein V3T72_00590, partial [Thermoanaerobaculia bacterium]
MQEVVEEAAPLLRFCRRTKNRSPDDIIVGVAVVARELAGDVAAEWLGDLPLPHGADFEEACAAHEGYLALTHYRVLRSHALYLLGDFEQALSLLEKSADAESYIAGSFSLAIREVSHGLVLAALHSSVSPARKPRLAAELDAKLLRIGTWAENCPENFRHKYLLVAGERARIAGNDWEAADLLDEARSLARKNGSLPDEALANELSARLHFGKGRTRVAESYLRDARDGYLRWGAATKVRRLEEEYPEHLATASSPPGSRPRATSDDEWTATSESDLLDRRAVSKAAQAISSEVVLKDLLAKLTTIFIEHAGARKGALILERDGEWMIEAEGGAEHSEVDVLQATRLEAATSLSPGIVNYVKRTGESLVIPRVADDSRFAKDPYVLRHKP